MPYCVRTRLRGSRHRDGSIGVGSDERTSRYGRPDTADDRRQVDAPKTIKGTEK
ncbi:MAG: hypothetical protein R2795_13040 [Saprospiraceae bacterium]